MPKVKQRDPRKVLPQISWDAIAPPYTDYPYFQGGEEYPFRPHAGEFDMVNAWWLIEASTLAYAEEDFAREKFQRAGLVEVKFFNGDSAQCYVAHNDDFLILAFRGTEIRKRPGQSSFQNILADLKADADFLLVDSGQGGKVHRGFQEALDEVWEQKGLVDHLRSKDDGRRTFWFTGHSLGGALATLAAHRYGAVNALFTYGSPRVGDLDFQQGFPVKTYRFVNHHDIVTRVPPSGAYRHVGEMKYIDSRGLIGDNPLGWEGVVNGGRDEILSALNSLEQVRVGFGVLIPDMIVDHVPTLYATHIWNNIP